MTLVGISSVIYKYKKTIWGAVIGLLAAAAATMGIMTLANIVITPHYLDITTGMDLVAAQATVKSLLPTTIIPFNIVKSILNASIAMLLYKPLTEALRRARLIDSGKKITFNKNTLIILIVGAAALITALAILLIIW